MLIRLFRVASVLYPQLVVIISDPKCIPTISLGARTRCALAEGRSQGDFQIPPPPSTVSVTRTECIFPGQPGISTIFQASVQHPPKQGSNLFGCPKENLGVSFSTQQNTNKKNNNMQFVCWFPLSTPKRGRQAHLQSGWLMFPKEKPWCLSNWVKGFAGPEVGSVSRQSGEPKMIVFRANLKQTKARENAG